MLASCFKTKLRNDIDADMEANFRVNLKPVRNEIILLESQINTMEKQIKKNNVTVHGLKEDEKTNSLLRMSDQHGQLRP